MQRDKTEDNKVKEASFHPHAPALPAHDITEKGDCHRKDCIRVSGKEKTKKGTPDERGVGEFPPK